MAIENKKISELTNLKKNDDMVFPAMYSGDNYGIQSTEMGRNSIQSLSASGTISKSIVEINASVKRVIATLPDRAEWEGKTILIKNKVIGVGLIQRAGSDVIGEDSKTSIPLYWKGDYLELFAGTSRWEIKSGRSKIGGVRNCSEYRNIYIAGIIEVDIDGGNSPFLGYDIGEKVEESTSLFQGRIYDITDNGDGTGTLWTYDNDGNYTDGRTLTGQNSSATSSVNEGSGTTKNLSTIFKNNYNENLSNGKLKNKFYFSSDGTENNYVELSDWLDGGTVFGWQVFQQDSNNLIFYTRSGGAGTIIGFGGISTQNSYHKTWIIINYGG